MDILPEYNVYFYGIAIVLTICALVVSTRYTMKNILKHWGKGTVKSENADDKSAGNPRESGGGDDDGGSEGDDEADEDEAARHGDRLARLSEKLGDVDPMEYCEHIQGEVKRVKQKVATKQIQESMSQEQLEEEREVQQQQLEQIFALMKEQEEKFGVQNVTDIKEQMKLYA
ncbi:hypothetical protein LOTGIDRAFT_229500 [Lottia gigantea]|uniref:Matrix-remodeling-associated protein 7 helical domain-containing protein n=1 Tax=Lottia gigantea TaxID=225164 RepID=V3ZSQ4_LOTGI|nr:hypothetical protein LOTGIDRAFT_229500 [Lottia gigantea]ESO83916.1 hypothetical protein LOTGIDRAFT_229500 [Lottia gigantea]